MSECSMWQLATEGDVDGLKARIRGYPDEINKKNGPQFTTPLMQGCSNNLSEVVKLLLECDDINIAVRDKDDATCIHWAAGHSPLCLALIMSHGYPDEVETDLYRPDLSGNTPLHWAAMFGQYCCCQILLAAGVQAPLKLKNLDGRTPEKLAHKSDTSNWNTRELLRTSYEDLVGGKVSLSGLLDTACEWGLTSVVYKLISKGAKLKTDMEVEFLIGKQNKLMSPESKNLLKQILKDQAVMDFDDTMSQVSDSRQTCVTITSPSLWVMAKRGRLMEVSQYLKTYKEEINQKDGEMFTTSLMEAAAGNHYDVFNILLEHGASVHIRDKEDASCLHYAAGSSPVCLVLLLNKDLDFVQSELCRQDHSGNTPLHWAARKGRLPCCELLLAAGGHEALLIESFDDYFPDKIAAESLNSNNKTRMYLKEKQQLLKSGVSPLNPYESLVVSCEWAISSLAKKLLSEGCTAEHIESSIVGSKNPFAATAKDKILDILKEKQCQEECKKMTTATTLYLRCGKGADSEPIIPTNKGAAKTNQPTEPQPKIQPTEPQPKNQPTEPQPKIQPTEPQPKNHPSGSQPKNKATATQPRNRPTTLQSRKEPSDPQPMKLSSAPEPKNQPSDPQHGNQHNDPQAGNQPTEPTDSPLSNQPADPPPRNQPTISYNFLTEKQLMIKQIVSLPSRLYKILLYNNQLVCLFNDCIETFDRTTGRRIKLLCKGFHDARSMAITASGQILLATQKEGLLLYNMDGQQLAVIDNSDWHDDVTALDDGAIALRRRKDNTLYLHADIYDSLLRRVRQVTTAVQVGGEITCAVSNGSLFICSYVRHRVYQVDLTTGQTVRAIGSRGSRAAQLNSPFICCTDDRYLLIADEWNHRFQVLDIRVEADGWTVLTLPTVKYPTAAVVGSAEELYVAGQKPWSLYIMY